jgi:hypothetical protein
MSTFLLCAAALVLGYFAYGSLLDRLVRPDASRPTPALSMADAVDYVPMSTPRLFLIQLLNIAGLGPVFGAILGALYGPLALVWIVVGCLFAGGVHDYLSGMLSLRAGGESLPDVVGRHLGGGFKHLIRVFSLLLMVLVGGVVVLGPAKLLAKLSGLDAGLWVGLIFAYYFLATILPFDKIIGRLYPFFGALLLFMAAAMPIALLGRGYQVLPELALSNLHPDGLPVWPLLFTTVACGAISGFHSTQSPMVARCMKNERDGRLVFFGAMVAEGLIALVWATVGMSFYPGPEALGAVLAAGGPATVVNEACTTLLGPLGGCWPSWAWWSCHQHRRHRFPRGAAHCGGLLPRPPARTVQAAFYRGSAVPGGHRRVRRQLRAAVALHGLGQSKPGHSGPVDHFRLPCAAGQRPLDRHGASPVHDRHDQRLHPERPHRLQSAHGHGHGAWNLRQRRGAGLLPACAAQRGPKRRRP